MPVNAALLVIALIETPTAVAYAEAIAAVPGIDALLIGTNDLGAEMGIPGEFGHARIADAYETVIAACRKHSKWPGMGGVDAEELMQKYIGMGMRLVLTGSDGGFMMAGAARRAGQAREWRPGPRSVPPDGPCRRRRSYYPPRTRWLSRSQIQQLFS